eukprot:513554_1
MNKLKTFGLIIAINSIWILIMMWRQWYDLVILVDNSAIQNPSILLMTNVSTNDGDLDIIMHCNDSTVHNQNIDIVKLAKLMIAYKNNNTKYDRYHSRFLITEINKWNLFGPIMNMNCLNISTNDITFIITIRGYQRVTELEIALNYWTNVTFISSNALMIISLDSLHLGMIELIQRKCDFVLCKLIIHPYAASLLGIDFDYFDASDYGNHHNMFLVNKPKSKRSIKHHFWWLLYFVFEHFIPSHVPSFNVNHHQVLFFEEDHIVSTDILFVTKQMNDIALNHKLCDNRCLNLRFFDDGQERMMKRRRVNNMNLLAFDQMFGHGNQMAMNHQQFELFDDYSWFFCNFSEYNWDYTIATIRSKLYNKKNITHYSIQPQIIRSIHIGFCGASHDKQNLSETQCIDKMTEKMAEMDQINKHIQNNKKYLKMMMDNVNYSQFQQSMIFKMNMREKRNRDRQLAKNGQKLRQHPGYGNWHSNDRHHCMQIAQTNKSIYLMI